MWTVIPVVEGTLRTQSHVMSDPLLPCPHKALISRLTRQQDG
jgi:hypothetical protein